MSTSRKRGRRSATAGPVAQDDQYTSEDEVAPRPQRRRAQSVTATEKPKLLVTPKRNQRSRSVTPGLQNATPTRAKDRATPALLNLPPFLDVSARKAKALFVFGNGEMGQFGLGLNALNAMLDPTLHSWFSELFQKDPSMFIEDVACGSWHTLVLISNGCLLSWGVNDNGALGRSTSSKGNSDIPTEVLETQPLPVEKLCLPDADPFRPTCIAAGDSFSVCLSDSGDIRQFGAFRSSDGLLGARIDFEPFRTAIPTKLAQVAAGADFLLALDLNGGVWASGNAQQGQLGRKILERRKENGLVPQKLALRKAVYVAAGEFNGFAVLKNGSVHAWGLNGFRQSGVAERDGGFLEIIVRRSRLSYQRIRSRSMVQVMPTEIKSLHANKHAGRRVTAIAAGEFHSLFLFDDGQLYGCGRTDGYELGLDDRHPAMVRARESSQTDLGLCKSPTVKQETQEYHEAKTAFIAEPTKIPFPYEGESEACIVQIVCIKRHNFAVSQNGVVYAWGFSPTRSLGLGDGAVPQLAYDASYSGFASRTVEVQPTPRALEHPALKGFRVIKAAAGLHHTVLLAEPRAEAA